MKLSPKLYFKNIINSDFSVQGYKKILVRALLLKYKFISFKEYENKKFNQKTIILRHDVDIDVSLARIFAKIESSLKIKSTFFFMINNNLYNIFSKNNKREIKSILQDGHSVGLHYDVEYYGDNKLNNIIKNIDNEIKFFKSIFNYQINYVSFHKPINLVKNNDVKNKNFTSVYNKLFFKNIRYISDSGAFWKEKFFGKEAQLDEILKQNKEPYIHLLIHPELWFFSKEKILNNRLNDILYYKYANSPCLLEEEINSKPNKIFLYKYDKKNCISIKPY
jgi:hypothetical protein